MVIFAINSMLLLPGSDNSNTNEFTGYFEKNVTVLGICIRKCRNIFENMLNFAQRLSNRPSNLNNSSKKNCWQVNFLNTCNTGLPVQHKTEKGACKKCSK